MCSLAKGDSSSSWAETQTLQVSPGKEFESRMPVHLIQFSGNAQPAGFRPRGANTGFQVQPEPGGGRDPTLGVDAAERAPMLRTARPRCSRDPQRAARQPARCSAPASTRPAAPSRAQPRCQPEPHLPAVAPPSVLTEADGRCRRRRRLPRAPRAPRLPPASPASPPARPRRGGSQLAPGLLPRFPPRPMGPAAAEPRPPPGGGGPSRRWGAGRKGHSRQDPGSRLGLNLDLPRGNCRPQPGAEWHSGRGENVSASPPFSHTHTESQPFRRQFEITSPILEF